MGDKLEISMEEAKSSPQVTIVSLAPQRAVNPSVHLKKLASGLLEERKAWQGIDASFCGFPLGLKSGSSACSEHEARTKELLLSLPDYEPRRPPLVRLPPFKDPVAGKEATAAHSKPTNCEFAYKLYKSDGKLVRSLLEQSSFVLTEGGDWNLLWAGAALSAAAFEGLGEFRKVNHFPEATQLTRKDKMYANIAKMQRLWGKAAMGFVPETYVLPGELSEFTHRFQTAADQTWIAKPSASSQGKGIFLVESLSQLPTAEPYIVSQYIANPLLVNNLKFDMRIYVLVTSYDPLRIYVYSDGLARFASEEYTGLSKKDARFVHLTNYSVNKRNANYVANQDYSRDNVGHKWSLSALFRHLDTLGVDSEFVWMKIYDLIIKSIISVQEAVTDACSDIGTTGKNCFDLFGFDVLLDNSLKPWLLEVNLSPSLATETSLDWFIKGNLVTDTLNLVGLRGGEKKKELNKPRIRFKNARKAEYVSAPPSRPSAPVHHSSSDGSPRLREALRDTLEEFDRRGHFIRIFPSKGSDYYSQFITIPQTTSQWLHWILFENGTLECLGDTSTSVPSPSTEPVSTSASTLMSRSKLLFAKPRNANFAVRKGMTRGKTAVDKRFLAPFPREKSFSTYSAANSKGSLPLSDKVVVTGDDILMEYIARLVRMLMSISEDSLTAIRRKAIEAFIVHPVWKYSDPRAMGKEFLWQRLEGRYSEMKVRRLRIAESESRLKGGLRDSAQMEEQRRNVVAGFSAAQLEDMLRASTRNVAREVVAPLLDHGCGGALSDLQAVLTGRKSGAVVARKAREVSNCEEEEAEKSPQLSPRRRDSLQPLSAHHVLRSSWKLHTGKPRPQSMVKSMRG